MQQERQVIASLASPIWGPTQRTARVKLRGLEAEKLSVIARRNTNKAEQATSLLPCTRATDNLISFLNRKGLLLRLRNYSYLP